LVRFTCINKPKAWTKSIEGRV